jgi:hypothetical protein
VSYHRTFVAALPTEIKGNLIPRSFACISGWLVLEAARVPKVQPYSEESEGALATWIQTPGGESALFQQWRDTARQVKTKTKRGITGNWHTALNMW